VSRGHHGVAIAALTVAIAALAGCGRLVVVEPETVAHVNDREWTVKSEPQPAKAIVSDAGVP
jgi:hypothetical protein